MIDRQRPLVNRRYRLLIRRVVTGNISSSSITAISLIASDHSNDDQWYES